MSPSGEKATAAGVYDWFLGGRYAGEADIEAAIASQRAFPVLARTVLYNRQFLQRVVRYLVGQGVRQFLDLGSGYPSSGNVHEIAQELEPGARVVYVDHEQGTVDVGREILAGNPDATSILGDVRDPEGVLNHPEVGELLDFTEPVGVLMIAVLHFLPDTAEAARIVRRYVDHLAPGSYLAISHGTYAAGARELANQTATNETYNRQVSESAYTRTFAEIESLFAGTTLVPPGLVLATEWHPEDPAHEHDEEDEASAVLAGGVGRVDPRG
ncbi:SAM-dependent methyltransferase [Amycolatopsis sacchari]|uniref:SAM-dependent methyltransferase n=1 Tax=Amycolatopsis sacchari TaxID=115433 RepID=UPI003D75FEB5